MNYFEYRTLLKIHDKVLEVSSGMEGIKDRGLLESPLAFIKDDNYYPGLQDKLTHLVYSLIKNHGFHDGNKRTALAAGGLLLSINGYENFVGYYFLLFEQVMVLVADDRLTKDQLRVLFCSLVENGELDESSKIMIIDAMPQMSFIDDIG